MATKNTQKRTLYAVDKQLFKRYKDQYQNFTIDQLKILCEPFASLLKTVPLSYNDKEGNKPLCECRPVNAYLTFSGNKPKRIYVSLLAFFMADNRNLIVYIDALPDKDKQVWKFIADYGIISEKTFARITGRKFYKSDYFWSYYYNFKDIDKALWLFSNLYVENYKLGHKKFFSVFPAIIRPVAFSYFHPQASQPISPQELPSGKLHVVTDSEQRIFPLFMTIQTLFKAQKLALSKTGKLLKAHLNIAKKQLEIQEYFPQSSYPEQTSLHSAFLLLPLLNYFEGGYDIGSCSIPMHIKNAVKEFLLYADTMLPSILPHLKGLRQPKNNDLSHIGNTLLEVLGECSDGWLSVEDIILKMKSLKHDYNFFTFYNPDEFLRLDIQNKKTEEDCEYEECMNELFVPFLKTILFVLNALGALDIAFTDPQKLDVSYVDSLRYVRLTAFGSFVTDKTSDYKPVSLTQKKYYELDTAHLFLRVLGEENPYKAILDDIAVPVGQNRYKVSEYSMLRNCVNEADLKGKINSFACIAGKDMPEVWNEFFTSLISKCNPLTRILQTRYTLYKVNKDDKELIRLLVTDEFLKSHMLRAEGYILLIEKKSVADVIKRLKQFGYILTE